MIQDIIDTGLVQWGGSKEEAKTILGGHQPWTGRVIRPSTCPEVGSMFNEGIWNAQKKTWEGSAIWRTMEGDEANYTALHPWDAFLASRWLQYAADFEMATCLGPLVHFALDNGHGTLGGGVCRPGG